jgi:signal transduction histidine kinase
MVENGPMIGLSVLAVTVAFIFAIMTGFNSAMRRWPQHHSAIFIIGLVAVQVPTVVLSPLRMELTGEVISIGDLIISMVIGTFIVLATSSFGAWDRSRREMIADFRREVDEETIATLVRRQALAKATMDAAIVLHGRVQTQLHACAFTLEEATRRGDLVEVNRALVHARALLEQPDLAPRVATATSIQDALEERIAQWRGLLAVTVSVNKQAEALSGVIVEHVADVVEEAIANAVHHGSATEVLVSVSCDSDELTVQVCDNGMGPSNGAPGLGSRLFSTYDSRWSLQALTSGAELTVVVPSSVGNREALVSK